MKKGDKVKAIFGDGDIADGKVGCLRFVPVELVHRNRSLDGHTWEVRCLNYDPLSPTGLTRGTVAIVHEHNIIADGQAAKIVAIEVDTVRVVLRALIRELDAVTIAMEMVRDTVTGLQHAMSFRERAAELCPERKVPRGSKSRTQKKPR